MKENIDKMNEQTALNDGIGETAELLCTVVVPVYNEEPVIPETYRRLRSVMDPLGCPYEIIFVNDGSKDGTRQILSAICDNDRSAKLITFSRNFGHQAAITAGMDHSSGKTVVVIDADLQDPPELIPQMLDKWREGFDVVYGIRARREGETFFKKATSSLFYRLLKRITDVDMPLDAGDFRLIDRKVCDSLKKINERNRYVRGLISWLGFRQTGIEYVREKRFAGSTKYPLKKMLKFACDGIASFSYKPLKLANWCGAVITAVSIVYLLTTLLLPLSAVPGADTAGNADTLSATGGASATQTAAGFSAAFSLFSRFSHSPFDAVKTALAVSLLLNGVLLIAVGIIGAYTARIYDEVKGRPLYVVQETRNFEAGKGY